MSIRIPKPVYLVLSFLFALALYWPAMSGTPIWDDFTFWFSDPVMKPETSYLTIWKNFAWPLSVSIQKFTLSIWNKNYLYHHLLNFCLHFANSLLVYKLGRMLRFKYPVLIFLLFLLHPACVITTAWMIQIKTLLCFFFGLASMLTFMKGQKNLKWMSLSWVLFACSLTSKSASLTLPLIFLVMSLRSYRFSKLHLLLPFFLLSGWSTYRVLTSQVTQEGTEKASVISKVKTENVAPLIEEKPASPVATNQAMIPPSVIPKKEVIINNTSLKKDSWFSFKFAGLNFDLIAQTMNYYFWQSLLPLNNVPIKGLNFSKSGVTEIIHIIFLLTLVFSLLRDPGLIYLAAAYFLLLPFLGIMPAPFMNITWVSDQHLYLALPALLFFWMRIIEKIKWKYHYLLPVACLVFFSIKTHESSQQYDNQITFYQKSMDYNPQNVPIAYNLAFSYILNNQWSEANQLLTDTISLAQEEPLMKKSIYFPHLLQLYLQLTSAVEKVEKYEN